jgi:type III secretion protein C
MLGEGDIITLDLNEEITESLGDNQTSNTNVNGIRTTKTNMMTHVHVPDKHFLVLSGMIRNAKSHHKTGLPCLGGLPFIGNAFSKTRRNDEKRNVIIFVRPHIIHSFEDYNKITEAQEEVYKEQSAPKAFVEALEILPTVD